MRLLAVDIGNTNTVAGLFEGKRLKKQWRMKSTPEDCFRIFSRIPKTPRPVEGMIVSSVVPRLDKLLCSIAKNRFNVRAVFVKPEMKMPIRVRTKNQKEVGADRIVNAVAAWTRWKTDLVIVDFGTATTFDVVTKKGDYIGGIIAPGLRIANQALAEKTAKLPLVPLKRPKKVIGKTTTEAIQSGVFLGYASLVEGMIGRIQKEYGKKMKVVATGGLAQVISGECPSIDIVDSDLTLKGLFLLRYPKHTAESGRKASRRRFGEPAKEDW